MKSTDHILWFFSTCAQTFAALVSVFGMFVLYRLQIEEGRIGSLRERMLRFDETHQKLPFESIIESLGQKEASHRLIGELEHAETIRALLHDYAGATAKRSWLSKRTRHPILWLIVLTFWSLVGIVLYPSYQPSVMGSILIWLTLVLCIIPLYQVGTIISVSITQD